MNGVFIGGLIVLAILVIVGVYGIMFAKNFFEVKDAMGKGKVHFYDLATCPFVSDSYDDETEEQREKAVLKLNSYVALRKKGIKAELTDDIRDRFVRITPKSVAVVTFLQFADAFIGFAVTFAIFAFVAVAIILLG